MSENCACAHNLDGSVSTFLCSVHAVQDPCLTFAQVTGKRRRGSVKNGKCSNCGWVDKRVVV